MNFLISDTALYAKAKETLFLFHDSIKKITYLQLEQ